MGGARALVVCPVDDPWARCLPLPQWCEPLRKNFLRARHAPQLSGARDDQAEGPSRRRSFRARTVSASLKDGSQDAQSTRCATAHGLQPTIDARLGLNAASATCQRCIRYARGVTLVRVCVETRSIARRLKRIWGTSLVCPLRNTGGRRPDRSSRDGRPARDVAWLLCGVQA